MIAGEKTPSAGMIVENPQEFDILLGRGKISFNHVGNRRFRVFVGMHLKRYMDANNRMEKTIVVNSVVKAIHEAGGRFLKEDSKSEKWVVVTPKMAREKVGHALRDAVGIRMKMLSCNSQGKNNKFEGNWSPLDIAASRQMSEGVFDNAEEFILFSESTKSDIQKGFRLVANDMSFLQNFEGSPEQFLSLSLQNQGGQGSGEKIFQGGSSQLNFDALENIPRPDAASIHPTLSNSESTLKSILVNTKISKDDVKKKMPNEEQSGEFSVISDVSHKKWFELGSEEFSVSTHVFDDEDEGNDALPQHAIIKARQVPPTVDKSCDISINSSSKSISSKLFSRKLKESLQSKASSRSASTDINLSEEFSIMSIDTRYKFDSEDFRLKSEEFAPTSGDFNIAKSGIDG
jgi:hypothetical protein